MNTNRIRSKWAAVGAAIAVSLGAGGIGIGHATTSTGEKPIYLPIEPCRLADTRPAFQVGPRSTPLGAAETYDLSGWGAVGNCTLPADTAGLALNVTAVDPTAPTFLTIFPDGVPLPLASNLNPTPGEPPTPNAVNVDLSAAGMFSVYNLAGNVHIAIDVVGIYDDHNHDDRYNTKDEIADLPTMPDAVAAINANATVQAGGTNIVSSTYNAGLSRYEIDFDDLDFWISRDVALITVRDQGVIGSYSSLGGSTLLVYLRDTNNNPVQDAFSFVVYDLG